jgi:hypothetical protein
MKYKEYCNSWPAIDVTKCWSKERGMNMTSTVERKRLIIFVAAYLTAYFVASWMDLSTTSVGLTQPGVSEKNVLAVTSEGYSSKNAWLLTAAGAVILTACILESFRNSHRVAEHWLKYPVRSFGKLYFNPWSEEAIKFTPIHFLSLAIAFLLLRMLAALNNLAVILYGFGPMGELMEMVASKTSPLIGFITIGFFFFIIVTLAVAPFAAKVIRSWRHQS